MISLFSCHSSLCCEEVDRLSCGGGGAGRRRRERKVGGEFRPFPNTRTPQHYNSSKGRREIDHSRRVDRVRAGIVRCRDGHGDGSKARGARLHHDRLRVLDRLGLRRRRQRSVVIDLREQSPLFRRPPAGRGDPDHASDEPVVRRVPRRIVGLVASRISVACALDFSGSAG